MKSSFFRRFRKKIPLLLLLLAAVTISAIGYSKFGFDIPEDNVESAKHYNTKGKCPGIGIANAKLKTKFSGDKVYYLLNLTSARGKKAELPRSFTVKLTDKDGFDIQAFMINSANFTAELNETEAFVGYSYQSAQRMDEEKYKSVAGWNLTWSLK